MKNLVAISLLSVAVTLCSHSPSHALAPFKKAFQKKYVDDGPAELKAEFKKQSCNTCHVKGKKKDVRNEYGEELAKLIDGDANKRIKAAKKNGPAAGKAEQEKILVELEKAFEAVGKLKNKAGEPFEERLDGGMLPVETE